MTALLALLLALAAGWYWGHRTARVRLIVLGAHPAADQAELDLADACCEQWWTSCGAHHEPACERSST
ncbi:hypothetical protein [Streptomyces uncialis]|uniref:hypothetical protein n=1 Tax=Streptomyces uncialis TaxID=1048205 RepID=UPI0037A5DD00